MKDFKSIIERWVNEYTVPYNTTPSKKALEIFARPERTAEDVDEFMHCEFIVFDGERRIIIENPYFKHDFYVCIWDNPHKEITYKSSFHELMNSIMEPSYDSGETMLGDSISVNIEHIHDIISFFDMDFNFEESEEIEDDDYRIEDGCFVYQGDQWDYDAEYYFKDSELYKKLTETLVSYLQYDFAPYRKYNPNFDYFQNNKPLKDYDKMFELLTKEQAIETLTAKCYEGHSISENNNPDLIKKFIESLNDMELVKNYIRTILFRDVDIFTSTAQRMFNL